MPDAIKLQESISQITRAIRNMIDLYDADEEKIRFVALQSAHESARDAIKGCLLINSGAAGALLVFIGHLATVKNEVLIVNLSPSFRYFMVGIVASLIAQIVTWVSYWTFSQTLTKHCSKWCRWIVGFLIIVSIIAFVGGGILSYNALQAQAKIPASPRGLTIQ